MYRTIQNLNNNDKLAQNKESFSKYIINTFIFSPKNFQPLIKSLLTNDKSNSQHNEIIKSLDNDTKQYLLNAYNINHKIKIEAIPQLNNYSQQQLIQMFNDSLNDKNKKEFNTIISKYDTKEISAPYLSSTLNANILNNELDNNILKSKNECLSNIKNIRNKCLNLSNNITNKHNL